MGKYESRKRRTVSSRTFIMLLALVLVIGVAAGSTVAWLTAKTAPVVNTFTYGDINITLAETTGSDYKIIPGKDISKDPKVTVKDGSEACYLFVKVEEADWPEAMEADATTRKVNYAIADGWTALEGQSGVYYRVVPATTADTSFDVLKGSEAYPNGVVTVSENLTKAEISGITTQPKLTFTAYAVQQEGFDTAAEAWNQVKDA